VPLSADAVILLRSLPLWRGGDFTFTTTSGRQPAYFSTRARKSLCKDFTLHDIRRTVRTRLSALRVPEIVAELIIGHSKRGMTRIYDQHKFQDEMREALEAWAIRLRTIVAPEPTDNVIELRRNKVAKGD
jgi:integrase